MSTEGPVVIDTVRHWCVLFSLCAVLSQCEHRFNSQPNSFESQGMSSHAPLLTYCSPLTFKRSETIKKRLTHRTAKYKQGKYS